MTLLKKGSPTVTHGTFLPYFVYKDEEKLVPIFKINIGGTLANTLLDTGAISSYIPHKVLLIDFLKTNTD
jgi:hypothetical protein